MRSLPDDDDRELAPAAFAEPPPRPEKALSFGRDNRLVLETLLGYTPEKIAALAEAGVLL